MASQGAPNASAGAIGKGCRATRQDGNAANLPVMTFQNDARIRALHSADIFAPSTILSKCVVHV